MALYITVTIAVTEWRTSFRKDMIELDNGKKKKPTVFVFRCEANGILQLPGRKQWTRCSILKPSSTFPMKRTKSVVMTML